MDQRKETKQVSSLVTCLCAKKSFLPSAVRAKHVDGRRFRRIPSSRLGVVTRYFVFVLSFRYLSSFSLIIFHLRV